MALNILAVSSEVFPLAKTGGLGDAVSGMAQSVHASGASTTLLLPAYRGAMAQVSNIREVAVLSGLPGGDAKLLACECPTLNLPILLLKNDALYDREGIYADAMGQEYSDNAVRFAALAHAATRIAQGLLPVVRPNIVHAHDWHAALTPLLMRQARINDVKSVLTLHNIAFQGIFPMNLAPVLGIEDQFCNSNGAEFWGQLSFLKAGIRFADVVTVVSSNYAREILTPQFGCGLEGLLASRGDDLIPIANGIDVTLWDPEHDHYLNKCRFSARNLKNKSLCKRDLQRHFDLEDDSNATLMAMGSRLTTQKMADIAAEAIPRTLDLHSSLQVCVIGQGDKSLETALQAVARRYPGRCGVHIGFDEPSAHLLHAGADILLHGSRFEPFGLTPLYSMRYGTIPIGSKVGGMADTITDPGAHQPAAAMRFASGILFEGESVDAMVHAIERAVSLRELPEIWRAMQKNGMTADFSWAKTAPAYTRLYESLMPASIPHVTSTPVRERSAVRPATRLPKPSAAISKPALAVRSNAVPAKPQKDRSSHRNEALDALLPNGA